MSTASTIDSILTHDLARNLYEGVKELPVIDYHTYLSPERIVRNTPFENPNAFWLLGDTEKRKAMRVMEGNSSPDQAWEQPRQYFSQWAGVMPGVLRHPLYQWSQLELEMLFGWKGQLGPQTADEVFDLMSSRLGEAAFRPQEMLMGQGIRMVGVVADPADKLDAYRQTQGLPFVMKPIFCPDAILAVEDPESFNDYLNHLSQETGFVLEHFIDLLNAIQHRIDTFDEIGCRLAHHRMELMYATDFSHEDVNYIYHKIRHGHLLLPEEMAKYRSALLYYLSGMYHEKGWTQQFRLGTIRRLKGQDIGQDAMGDDETAWYILRYLHYLQDGNQLPRTIFIHPQKYALLASIAVKFNRVDQPDWVQVRPSWQLMAHYSQLLHQFDALSYPGLVHYFPGLPSEARVFPSIIRHHYARMILANHLAREVANGMLPADEGLLTQWLANVSSHQPASYHHIN